MRKSSVQAGMFVWYDFSMMKRIGKFRATVSSASKPPVSSDERVLERKVRAANRALLVERLWPRVWLPVAVCGVFVLLSAFEVWQYLPPRLHLGLLVSFGMALAASLVPLFLWRRPTRRESFQRLEHASAL